MITFLFLPPPAAPVKAHEEIHFLLPSHHLRYTIREVLAPQGTNDVPSNAQQGPIPGKTQELNIVNTVTDSVPMETKQQRRSISVYLLISFLRNQHFF